jgi:tRNA A-37 threonylcarbamoyl transferase component Bud32
VCTIAVRSALEAPASLRGEPLCAVRVRYDARVPDTPSRMLKDSLHRSVRLEVDADGRRTVVKRFSSRTLAASTLDRARAAREHRLLGELAARGIPAPRPLALERVDGGWEVRMEWVADAQPLAELLGGAAPWPTAPERAMRRFAELLAKLHAAGVDHPDLHPGNVLLDANGCAWAIDFHKARRVERLGAKAAWRDLTSLAAGVRELTPPRCRARFLVAWLRHAPRDLGQALIELGGGTRTNLAARLEERARERRFAAVRKRRDRWLRESSSCAPVRAPFVGFRRATAQLDEGDDPRAPLLEERRALVLDDLAVRDATSIWCSAARLEEHGLAALRPRALCTRPTPWVCLEAALPGRPCRSPADVRGVRALHSLGRLCARLADRRLQVRSGPWPALWRADNGELCVAAARELDEDPRGGDGLDLVRLLALAGLSLEQLGERERAAYAAGIVAGSNLGAREKARLRARLRHG